MKRDMWTGWDLNPRPPPCQGGANYQAELPAQYFH